MERLVGDLLDSTAIESGVLRLQRDWCDLPLVVGAAAHCLSPAGPGRASRWSRGWSRSGPTTTGWSRSS